MGWSASGRAGTRARRRTRAMPSSGTRWRGLRSSSSACCRFDVSARLKLFLLFVACAAPFALGWAAWYFGWGTGRPGNYGELITPRLLTGPVFEPLRGRWLLVAFDTAACDAYCEKKLYYMRQIRTALGKDQGRVERLWVL